MSSRYERANAAYTLREVAKGRFEGPSYPTFICAGCPITIRWAGSRWVHTLSPEKPNAAHRAGRPWVAYPEIIPKHKAAPKERALG